MNMINKEREKLHDKNTALKNNQVNLPNGIENHLKKKKINMLVGSKKKSDYLVQMLSHNAILCTHSSVEN